MAASSSRDNKANCGPNVRNRGRAFVYERFQLRLVMPADGRNGPSSFAADTLGVPRERDATRRLRARGERASGEATVYRL
jgi:hypothetical protein